MKQLTKSSNKPRLRRSFDFAAIGTRWWVGFYEDVTATTIMEIKAEIAGRIEEFDRVYSRFRQDSLVTKISKKAGRYEFPPDSEPLFPFYERLYDITDGAVTPLIGQALDDAGYDAGYSLKPKVIREVPEWRQVMKYEAGTLETSQPVSLDFGAAGKGYLVDIVAEIIRQSGVRAFCVDASGDMFYESKIGPLRVGLEHPDDASLAVGWVGLTNEALCGSSINRRAWRNFNHIMNPRSRRSVTDIKAVWVTAANTMLADGLATALFFAPPKKILSAFTFGYVIINGDDSAEMSNGFNGGLY